MTTNATPPPAPNAFGAPHKCFGCGAANRTGMHLRFVAAEPGHVTCRLKAATRFEGPPGYMHGGAIATLMDEAMSKASRSAGGNAMTRKMEVEYLRPVPLRTLLLLEGRLIDVDGRKRSCRAELKKADGKLLARANGLFIAVGHDAV